MATSKAKLELNDKFLKQLDDIKIRVPKGYRQVIKDYAEFNNISVNELFISLLNERFSKEPKKINNKENPFYNIEIPSGVKKLSDEERELIRIERDKQLKRESQ